MGHHSVAEHAVFNFDVIGVSRLAIEEIEKFRLCSFTEKSQRYIKLEDDYIIPEEVKKARKEELFIDTIKTQNRLYNSLYEKLKPYVFETNKELAENPRNHSMLDGWAKEDARYTVCLAMEGQLGLTLNARNLEFLIRRFSSKKLAEIKEFKQAVYTLAKEVAPSIILFTESNDFDVKTYKELEEEVGSLAIPEQIQTLDSVKLIDHTSDADTKLIASLLHSTSSRSFAECIKKAKSFDPVKKKQYIKKVFQYMEFYNSTLREFEFVDLTFDLILSATSFAQLKRHRMATITAQDYNPALGVTVPPTIIEIGQKKEFMRVIERTNEAYEELKKHMEIGAEYVLTNAHRRRILLKLNARELYHVSRLREDATAQWDIRVLSGKMTGMAKEIMPLTCLLIGGKDIYPDLYKEVFGIPPKIIPPKP
jgi:flavin-dependent thymidylate synthase